MLQGSDFYFRFVIIFEHLCFSLLASMDLWPRLIRSGRTKVLGE
uniref:Uncharacterized protein n=1 Tax=Triticum urartu TaxID=4572 RepID=A0A8R7UAT9_TRIUA